MANTGGGMPKAAGGKGRAVTVATPTDLGALVREARERRSWTQAELGGRIGASRFWVAEFERGKAGAELGLALRAVAAVGLTLRVGRPGAAGTRPDSVPAGGGAGQEARHPGVEAIDLDEIVGIAAADLHVG